ncbi:MAG TPA: AEC family transporter [Usitatibacteraceae bacterium]|nr:AEC family transporter [Usitatibacteraceae bacterium]
MQTALLILPNFVLILAGLVLARGFDYGRGFWEGLEKLVYFVLFPALLLRSLAISSLDLAGIGKAVASAWAIMLLGMALAALARPLFRVDPRVAASCFQCAFRFNTYIGLAVAGSVFGAPGVAAAALLMGAMIPLANLGAVGMLAAHSRTNLWLELARNPLVVSTLAGFAWNLSGMGMPGFLDQTLGLLGQSALPAGLLAVGAALRIERGEASPGAHAWWLGVKLAVLPLAAWGFVKVLGLSGIEAGVLVLWAALPTASSAYILAVRMGGDGHSVATQITTGTLISMATIPLWVAAIA